MKHLISTILTLATLQVEAQQLTLEDAITIALDNNYNIQVSKNETTIAKNNVFKGNADLLPQVDLNGNVSTSQSTTDIRFATDTATRTGLQSESLSSNVSLNVNYTLFNGMGRIRTYQRLQEQGTLSEIQTKLSIESTIMLVINAYHEVLRNQNQLEILKSTLNISKDRLARLEGSYKYGSGNKIDILNAQVDFNTDSSNVLTTQQALENAKYNLNYLLGRDIKTEFEVEENISDYVSIDYESSKKQALNNNTNILLTQVNLRMSELDQKINQSRYMPIVASSINYGYSTSESSPSVVLNNKSLGFTGSLTLAWNLYEGGKKQRALENAKIAIDNSELQRQDAMLSIDQELANYHGIYENNLAAIKLEKQNLDVAKLNLQRSTDLFNQGQITNVQFRQAQLTVLNTQTKLNNAQYSAKINEYQIKRLVGELVKQDHAFDTQKH